MNDYILQPQVVPNLYSKHFCHYMRGILDTECWVFPKAEQEMTIVWALERHKNLDSRLVVYCHLQSIKTLVRTSFKANSYLIEIAQAGAKWGVIFDTMLAEADVAIPIVAIRRQFFGALTIDLQADFSLLFTSNLHLWPG
ncbi:hypothetical protein ACFX2H_022066 [Malus domestica]